MSDSAPSTGPANAPRVGIVGGGQLARMMCEAASALDVTTVLLAEDPQAPAARRADLTLLGKPKDAGDLRRLARACDVITFDHELVDLDVLTELQGDGVVLRPGAECLALTVDKSVMRRRLAAAGLPCPAHQILDDHREAAPAIDRFAEQVGWPIVIKAASGGYDGRGVWVVNDPTGAAEVCRLAAEGRITLLLEEHVAIERELAVMVARRPTGETVWWPAVETAQLDGVCREILVPGSLPPQTAARAEQLALRVAELAGATGVLAVELFATAGGLVVNELAARPHNSGHWTIEGAETSQFENHLRAVLDLPLGPTHPVAPHVATVNVFGGPAGDDPLHHLGDALGVPGAHVHLYGKKARPRRKLGHVTVRGPDRRAVRDLAWEAARRLGTPVPAVLVGSGA